MIGNPSKIKISIEMVMNSGNNITNKTNAIILLIMNKRLLNNLLTINSLN